MLVTPVVSVAVSWYLVANSTSIANGLFPDDQASPQQIERAMYRVGLTAVAVLIFAETLPHFVHAFGMTIIEQYEFGEIITTGHTFSLFNAPYLISFVFKLLIASYLLIGAPHLVNWQMSRSHSKDDPKRKFQFGITHLLVLMILFALVLGLLANGLAFTALPR